MDDPVGSLCRTPMNLFRKRFGEFCWHSAGLSVSRQRGMTLLMPMIVMRFGGAFDATATSEDRARPRARSIPAFGGCIGPFAK